VPAIDLYMPVATRYAYKADEEPTLPEERRPPQISGNKFAVLSNGWHSMTVISGAIKERLTELGAEDVREIVVDEKDYKDSAIQQAPPELLDEIASDVAGAISGLGNCGSCCSWSLRNGIELEARGVWAGHVCTEHFAFLANTIASSLGRDKYPIAVMPADMEAIEIWSDANLMRRLAEQVVYEVFGA
jgi:hypothetical protein